MLLLLGEVGRVADLSAFPEAEALIVSALSTSSEDAKATASLALGGVAVGNVDKFLPLVLQRIGEVDCAATKQLYLLLKSLKEVLRTLLKKNAEMQPGMQRFSLHQATWSMRCFCHGCGSWVL
jgi:cullin-associated NEDD8-dissociated protein 1